MESPQLSPLVDSHCHLNMLDLSEFDNNIQNIINAAHESGVEHMLCVCVEPSDLPALYKLAEVYANVSISVGIHPNTELNNELSATDLEELARHPSCIAIGETGLDYYRTEKEVARDLQRSRFRAHIRAAIASSKPLIIHTRQAAEDTLLLMKDENAEMIGGVMHCFSEDWDVARRALDLNFYISFSGIITFRNALALQEVAKKVPLEKMLIETDAPYLAPMPYRGKPNEPAYVYYVAEKLAQLKEMPFDEIAQQTTDNFFRLFHKEKA